MARIMIACLGRIVGPQEAEDLTQIAFAKAKALRQFRGDARASTWLYRIAANVASDWLRSRSAREVKLTVHLSEVLDGTTKQESTGIALIDIQSSPEQKLVRKDMRDHIRREIGQLPEGNREALILGELGGLTDEEMAQTLAGRYQGEIAPRTGGAEEGHQSAVRLLPYRAILRTELAGLLRARHTPRRQPIRSLIGTQHSVTFFDRVPSKGASRSKMAA